MEVKWKPSKKQLQAFQILTDEQTTELFYGGGAGGGKSYLGCFWIINCCLAYPGTRWIIGRAHLKILKESTLLTFFSILRDFNLVKDTDWKYNSMEAVVHFTNGSDVYLKDLFAYPSDPEFDSLGSTEYTGGFLDEVSEIEEKAKEIVMSRLRYKLAEYNLKPKLLMASNPSKGWAYREYWKPWSEGTIKSYRQFIPALVGDNPYMPPAYEENLKKLNENSKQRLLYGNWNYDDDPSALFEYDDMMDMFTNPPDDDNKQYLSVDVAREGPDKTVVIYWTGIYIRKIWFWPKSDNRKLRKFIEQLCYEKRIPNSHVIVDEDGIGGGIIDEMQTIKGFINGSSPIETEASKKKHNYSNLKTQCYYKLAEYVTDHKVGIYPDVNMDVKDNIIEDLSQVKEKDPYKTGKLQLIGKDVMKENLGRSPDFGDALMMRMYFELKPVGQMGYMSTK